MSHICHDQILAASMLIFLDFLDLCVSSLRRGHANLLCIVPILSDYLSKVCLGFVLINAYLSKFVSVLVFGRDGGKASASM